MQWLSAKTKQVYRLPSEAEWEYAARAGSKTERFWGNDAERACSYANVGDNTGTPSRVLGLVTQTHTYTDGRRTTAPVGSLRPNAFDLHTMIDNVWEWVADYCNQSYACSRPAQ